MNLRPFLLAGLLILAVLLAATGGLASTSQQAPSAIPNSGIWPAIDVNGTTIATAHFTNSLGIAFTYSNDGGASWTDRATGVTASSNATLRVFVLGPSNFTVLYISTPSGCSGASTRRVINSVDAGFTWSTPVILPENPTICGGSSAMYSTNVGANRFADGTIGVASLYWSGSDGCQYKIDQSINGGLTWTSGLVVASSATSNCFSSTVSTDLNGTAKDYYNLYKENVVYQVRNNALAQTLTVNDAFTAQTLDGTLHVNADGSAIFVRTTVGYIFMARAIGAATYQLFNSTVAKLGVIYQPFNDTLRNGFVYSQDTSTSVNLVHTCIANSSAPTWGNSIIQAAGIFDSHPSVKATANKAMIVFTNSTGLVYATNNDTVCVPTALPAPQGATNFTAFTNLQAFDVDPSGTTLFAKDRLNGTTWRLQVYAASSLASGAIWSGNTCNTLGGVAAAKGAVGQFVCTGNGSAVQSLQITSPSFTTIPVTGCQNGAGGAFIAGARSAGFLVLDNSYQLSNVQIFPIDFTGVASNDGNNPGCNSHSGIAAYSTGDGRVGYAVLKQDPDTGLPNNGTLTEQGVSTQLDSSSFPTILQISTCFNENIPTTSGNSQFRNYLAAAPQNGPATLYNIGANSNGQSTLTTVYSNSALYGNPTGFTCAEDRGLIIKNGAHLINTTSGFLVSDIAGSNPASINNAGALSLDGKWGAAVGSGGVIVIFNARNGTVVGSVPTPSGAYVDMRMSSRGQSLWVATSTGITLYGINNVTGQAPLTEFSSPYDKTTGNTTTLDACATNPPASFCSSIPVDAGGSLGGSSTITTTTAPTGGDFLAAGHAAAGIAGSDTAGNLLVALIVMICFGVGTAGIMSEMGKAAILPAFLVGLLAGFGYVVFQGLMPGIITFLVCAVAVGLGGFKAWSNSRSG